MFVPEGEFLQSFVQRCCDLVYGFTNTVHGSIISIQERRCSVNCFRQIACVQGEEYGPEYGALWYTVCNFGILRGYAINYSILTVYRQIDPEPSQQSQAYKQINDEVGPNISSNILRTTSQVFQNQNTCFNKFNVQKFVRKRPKYKSENLPTVLSSTLLTKELCNNYLE